MKDRKIEQVKYIAFQKVLMILVSIVVSVTSKLVGWVTLTS